jgi:hypothetical protein
MMVVISSQTILGYLKAEPFRPFRIHMASGRTFDIRHPEMVKTGKTNIVIFTYVSDQPEIYDKWDTVSLMLIENVSHLEIPVGQT